MMTSRCKRLLLLLFILSAAGLMATGCGNSSSNKAPVDPVDPVDPDNPFAMTRVGTDSTLEVVTWNLEHFAKSGGLTADLVIQAVLALDVDIVALQEIESASRFHDVVAGLDGWSGYKANSAGYDIDLAFIYRDHGLLQVDSIQEVMTGQGREFPRRPLLLLGSFDGKPIAVMNNHLKCCGNGLIDEADLWDEETRRRDACLLMEDYALSNLREHLIFFVGDFNDQLTDSMDHNVFANFLGDPNQWNAADMVIAEGSSVGWSFPGWPSHLDHIIINQPLFEAAGGSDSQVMVVPLFSFLSDGWSQYDREISDHLPVVLKLKP